MRRAWLDSMRMRWHFTGDPAEDLHIIAENPQILHIRIEGFEHIRVENGTIADIGSIYDAHLSRPSLYILVIQPSSFP